MSFQQITTPWTRNSINKASDSHIYIEDEGPFRSISVVPQEEETLNQRKRKQQHTREAKEKKKSKVLVREQQVVENNGMFSFIETTKMKEQFAHDSWPGIR